jgi:hypothetical protein
MKTKKESTKAEQNIIASVKAEMQKPRLAESVREAQETPGQAPPAEAN